MSFEQDQRIPMGSEHGLELDEETPYEETRTRSPFLGVLIGLVIAALLVGGDCCRLAELLLGTGSTNALNIGFLEITASAEVAVTAVYTSSGFDSGGISIDVQDVAGRLQ